MFSNSGGSIITTTTTNNNNNNNNRLIILSLTNLLLEHICRIKWMSTLEMKLDSEYFIYPSIPARSKWPFSIPSLACPSLTLGFYSSKCKFTEQTISPCKFKLGDLPPWGVWVLATSVQFLPSDVTWLFIESAPLLPQTRASPSHQG